MIVHEESQTTNNFVYQKDIPLISVPHQSIEIMTPCVLANQDSTIIVRIKNNLFNAMDGEIHADDSLVSMQAHHIFLHPKSTAMDTLVLNWKGVCKEGEHVVAIKSKKNNSIGTFTYKGIDINAGVKRPIGIFTVVDQSPLLVALRRIGYPVITLDTVDLHCFENISTVIIDEQSSKKVDSNSNTKKQLTNWILAGGKMIVLPQFYPNEVPIPDDSVIFNYKYPIISTNDITVDTACFAFNDPNILKFKNWQNAGSAIAYGEIHVKKSMPVSIPIKSQSTKMPLMVVRHYGLGSIVYIAFNLHPQLLTIQANAYKFLVNILNN